MVASMPSQLGQEDGQSPSVVIDPSTDSPRNGDIEPKPQTPKDPDGDSQSSSKGSDDDVREMGTFSDDIPQTWKKPFILRGSKRYTDGTRESIEINGVEDLYAPNMLNPDGELDPTPSAPDKEVDKVSVGWLTAQDRISLPDTFLDPNKKHEIVVRIKRGQEQRLKVTYYYYINDPAGGIRALYEPFNSRQTKTIKYKGGGQVEFRIPVRFDFDWAERNKDVDLKDFDPKDVIFQINVGSFHFFGEEEMGRPAEIHSIDVVEVEDTGGEMKDLGGPMDGSKREELNSRHEEFESIVEAGLAVREELEPINSTLAWVIRAGLPVASHNFYSEQYGLIVVIDLKIDDEKIVEEAKFHEGREAYWMGIAEERPEKTFTQQEAHIIAWGEWITMLHKEGRLKGGELTPYHALQLKNMDDEARDAISKETAKDRRRHHTVMREAAEAGAIIDMEMIKIYENGVRDSATHKTTDAESSWMTMRRMFLQWEIIDMLFLSLLLIWEFQGYSLYQLGYWNFTTALCWVVAMPTVYLFAKITADIIRPLPKDSPGRIKAFLRSIRSPKTIRLPQDKMSLEESIDSGDIPQFVLTPRQFMASVLEKRIISTSLAISLAMQLAILSILNPALALIVPASIAVAVAAVFSYFEYKKFRGVEKKEHKRILRRVLRLAPWMAVFIGIFYAATIMKGIRDTISKKLPIVQEEQVTLIASMEIPVVGEKEDPPSVIVEGPTDPIKPKDDPFNPPATVKSKNYEITPLEQGETLSADIPKLRNVQCAVMGRIKYKDGTVEEQSYIIVKSLFDLRLPTPEKHPSDKPVESAEWVRMEWWASLDIPQSLLDSDEKHDLLILVKRGFEGQSLFIHLKLEHKEKSGDWKKSYILTGLSTEMIQDYPGGRQLIRIPIDWDREGVEESKGVKFKDLDRNNLKLELSIAPKFNDPFILKPKPIDIESAAVVLEGEGGEMKDLGGLIGFRKRKEISTRHREFENMVEAGQAVRTELESINSTLAWVIRADLSVASHNFYSEQYGLIVVIDEKIDDEKIIEEAKFHEGREAYWMGVTEERPDKIFTQHEAHVIAWGEWITMLRKERRLEDGALTPYHTVQINDMTDEARDAITKETEKARQWPHFVMEEAIASGALIDMMSIKIYENGVRDQAHAINFIKAIEDKKPSFIALGTDWITGYKDREYPQYNAINPLISSLRVFCEERKIPFICGDKEALAKGIEGIDLKDKNAYGVVLAAEDTIDMLDLEDNENVFLAGVNNRHLDINSTIPLMEMLKLLVRFSQKAYTIDEEAIQAESEYLGFELINDKRIYFVPKTEPMPIDEDARNMYKFQIYA